MIKTVFEPNHNKPLSTTRPRWRLSIEESLERFGTVAFSDWCMSGTISVRPWGEIWIGEWLTFVPRRYRPDVIDCAKEAFRVQLGTALDVRGFESFLACLGGLIYGRLVPQ